MTTIDTPSTIGQTSKGGFLPVGLAVLSGLLANYLFYGRPLGISALIFTFLGLLVLYGLAFYVGVRPSWRNSWLAFGLVFLTGMVALRADPFITFLNLSAGLLLALLLAHTFSGVSLLSFGFLDYISTLIVSSVEILLIQPGKALVGASRTSSSIAANPRAAGALRGLVLAVPVVVIFTLLLSGADAAFNFLVQSILRWLHLDNLPELIARLIFSAVVGWGVLGGLAYALRKAALRQEPHSTQKNGPLGLIEAGVVLASVDLLFATFVGVQFRYFFGGQSNISVAGLTYAEYTRRGFAELVVVAIFSLGLALVLQRLTNRSSRQAKLSFEILAALLVALTGVILVSAFQRLLLYEQAYGFTQLRTYVHVFMLWVGVLLVVFLVGLHFNQPNWFVFGLLLAGLGFIVSLDMLNTDAFIVRQNLARYTQTGKLDAEYLATLSDDAVPDLLAALPELDPEESQVLGSALHYRLNELTEIEPHAGWAGWHFARSQAYRLLQQAQPELQKYKPKRYYWDFPME